MLRRSILRLSSCRLDGRIPIQITSQIPSYLSSRRAMSAASQHNEPQGPGSADKAESGSSLPKILVGGVALGAVVMGAYHTGYLDRFFAKEPHGTAESAKVAAVSEEQPDLREDSKKSLVDEDKIETIANLKYEQTSIPTPKMEHEEKSMSSDSDPSPREDLSRRQEESHFHMKDKPDLKSDDINHIQEEELPSSLGSGTQSDDLSANLGKPSEGSLTMNSSDVKVDSDQQKAVEMTPPFTRDDKAAAENETNSVPVQFNSQDSPKENLAGARRQTSSLLDDYNLKSDGNEPTLVSTSKSQGLPGTIEESYISEDGKLVIDFLQAIHAAEKRQAELDAHTFAEDKIMLKEKYEKELRDARARELMYAEREAILNKELNKERVKAAAALKSLQEKLEEKHKMELEIKKNEAELEMKKLQELAKAELASAIASEKAAQIEKMAEANVHINALCMAFYARSEEARQSHSVHKLALGALALEDALTKGLPIQKEMEALHTYVEGIDKDSLLDLVLSSIPEETRINGTDTVLQLNHKFDALRGTLRRYSLIPLGGGGILAHSLAHVASWLKVREADQSGDGIESLMNRVDSFLAEGKLSEAADALENGVKGTQAAEVVGDWVRRARNRAVTEQALTLLQSYATSISLT
nr:MICOS complex subunit MIC60-like [Coffea arabica]